MEEQLIRFEFKGQYYAMPAIKKYARLQDGTVLSVLYNGDAFIHYGPVDESITADVKPETE